MPDPTLLKLEVRNVGGEGRFPGSNSAALI